MVPAPPWWTMTLHCGKRRAWGAVSIKSTCHVVGMYKAFESCLKEPHFENVENTCLGSGGFAARIFEVIQVQ